MIKFNWDSMVSLSNGSSDELLRLMDVLVNPHMYRDPKLYLKLIGDNFLVNPEPLLLNRQKVSNSSLVQYIHLASLRNYLDFSFFNTTTIPLEFANYSTEELESNRLLKINNNQITLIYEDLKWH